MGPRFGAKNKHYDLGLNSHFLGLFYQIAEVSGNLSYSDPVTGVNGGYEQTNS